MGLVDPRFLLVSDLLVAGIINECIDLYPSIFIHSDHGRAILYVFNDRDPGDQLGMVFGLDGRRTFDLLSLRISKQQIGKYIFVTLPGYKPGHRSRASSGVGKSGQHRAMHR